MGAGSLLYRTGSGRSDSGTVSGKIILGGGVMHQEHMMPLVREEVRKQMAGYIKTKQMDDLDNYIVLPSLNDNQGIMGALKLAVDELELEK